MNAPEKAHKPGSVPRSEIAAAAQGYASEVPFLDDHPVTEGPARTHRRPDLAARFWSKVNKTEQCWLWTASLDSHGYGHLRVGGRGGQTLGAHRISWTLHFGPIPAGLKVVLHSCDNPPCVNPAHLFLGTSAVNSADMVAKGRSNRGERNGHAKLTSIQVEEILRCRAAGEPLLSIAEAFGISCPTVSEIAAGRKWKSHHNRGEQVCLAEN